MHYCKVSLEVDHKAKPFCLQKHLNRQKDKQRCSGPAVVLSLAYSMKNIPACSSSCQLAHTFSRCGPSLTSGLELNSLSQSPPNIAVTGRRGLSNRGKKRRMQRKNESHCNHWNETNVFFWKRPINPLDVHSMAEVIITVLRDASEFL